MLNLGTRIIETTTAIRNRPTQSPEIGVVLGSGLGDLVHDMTNTISIPYEEIPHFPVATVEGHAGQLVIGKLCGKNVVAMQGRFHFYEGYTAEQVTFPIRVMKSLGVKGIILTNAAGGMNPAFAAGDLMLITDHLNLTGASPLIGANDPALGVRFPDMSTVYASEWRALVKEVAKSQGCTLQEGVYAGISGPAYMTPAELMMLRTLDADAVGMSTVHEAIVCAHMQIPVLAISCITDMAIGESLEPLTHEQVVEMAAKVKPRFIELVKGVVKCYTT